jgi:chromosome segregation ATPase
MLSRISQLETHRGSMNHVISTFRSQSQVVQAELKLLDEQNDELQAQVARLTEAQTDIRARFKGLTGDVEQVHLVVCAEVRSELLKLEQDRRSVHQQFRNSAAEQLAMQDRLETVENLMGSFLGAGFTQTDREAFDTLNFNMSDPRGTFAKLQHELTGLVNKFDSGGGVDFHGYMFSHDQ